MPTISVPSYIPFGYASIYTPEFRISSNMLPLPLCTIWFHIHVVYKSAGRRDQSSRWKT